jgi:hypothetical protein
MSSPPPRCRVESLPVPREDDACHAKLPQDSALPAQSIDLAGLIVAEVWPPRDVVDRTNTRSDLRRRDEGTEPVDNLEHDIIARAVNEQFLDDGSNHPGGYRGITPRTTSHRMAGPTRIRF